MTISTLPEAPLVTDSASTFNSKAFAFVAALDPFVTEVNALAVDMENQSDVAMASADTATTAAAEAAASAANAAAAADVVKWVSGTTYTEGANVWSPADFQTYRRKSTGGGTTDPSADATNWQLITATASADPTILHDDDIGVTVQPYDADTLTTAAIGTLVQPYDADLAGWTTKTAPSGTVVGTSDSQTLTSKNIALGSNTISGTRAQFDSALSDDDFAYKGTTQTFTGIQSFGKATRETRVNLAAGAIDTSLGAVFVKTLASSITFSVSNVAASGLITSFLLDLTNGGAYSITWWYGIKWPGGSPPTLTASGRDLLAFFTYDGGATWSGMLIGRDLK